MIFDVIKAIGIVGMFCIVVAWIPQTLRTIKTKRTGMEQKFLWLYLIGSTALMTYAIAINDFVFTALNGIAVIFDVTNIYYYYAYEQYEQRLQQKLRRPLKKTKK